MKKTLCLLGLLLSPTAFAATWTNGTQVVENIIWKPGYHGFYTSSSAFHDPESCGGGSRLYLIDPALDEKTVDRLYAMLLAAWSTGKTVYVWTDGCIGGMPKFTGLQINN